MQCLFGGRKTTRDWINSEYSKESKFGRIFKLASGKPTVIVSKLIIEEEKSMPVVGDVDHARKNTEAKTRGRL